MVGMLAGTQALVVGVEDDAETGLLRVYISARYKNVYCLVEDESEQQMIRRAWASQQPFTVPIPPKDHIYQDPEPMSATAIKEAAEGGSDG